MTDKEIAWIKQHGRLHKEIMNSWRVGKTLPPASLRYNISSCNKRNYIFEKYTNLCLAIFCASRVRDSV